MISEPGHLQHAGRRASQRPAFMGYYLAQYRTIERIEDPELATLLGFRDLQRCPTNLAFARAPDPSASTFGADVQALADAFGASPIGLARLIRRVVAIGHLASAHKDSDTGFLAAARDREDESSTGGAGGGEPSARGDADPSPESP